MGDGHRHRRRPAVAGSRLGRRAGCRWAARAVLSVRAARQVSCDGRPPRGRGPRVLLLLLDRDDSAETAGGRGRRRRLDVRPHVSRALRRRRPPRSKRRARRARSVSRCRTGRRASTTACADRSRSTTPTSKTSSCCAPIVTPPITSRWSPTTSTWRSPTSSAATITSRTRPSRSCSTRPSGGRRRALRTCRSSSVPTRSG